MSNKYDAFTGLIGAAANAAHFLEATATRAKAGELSQSECANRLTDTAAILREAMRIGHEVFFTPDK